MQTIERVAEMLVTLSEFSDLLDLENAAIRTANTTAIAKLAERKEFLALHYQRQMRMLADRRDELAGLDPQIKKRLRDAWTGFSARQAENVSALKVAHDATQHVVTLIVDAIRQAQGTRREQTYGGFYRHGPYAGASANATSSAGAAVSVTFNRIL